MTTDALALVMTGPDEKDALLRVFTDEYSRRILVSTSFSPKTILNITKESGIPKSTCYRKIKRLLDLHLLSVESIVITDSGKEYSTYQSKVEDASIFFGSDEISVNVTQRPSEVEAQCKAPLIVEIRELLKESMKLRETFLRLWREFCATAEPLLKAGKTSI